MSVEIISKAKETKDAHYIEDCPSYEIPSINWLIQGYSVAGDRTGFIIKSLGVFLDGGMNSYKQVFDLFVTHSHADHTKNIPSLVMNTEHKITVHCPKELVKPLSLYNRASQSLNDCTELNKRDNLNYNGLSAEKFFELSSIKGKKGQHLYITTVKCHHTVPCIGYIFSIKKDKLKDEYKGFAGKEIGKLRKSGVEICNTTYEKKLAFLGDTTSDIFKNKNSELLKTPVIMIECTAINDKISVETARSRGHMHWDELEPIVKEHPEITFILIHFSRSYKEEEIIEHFKNQGYSNIVMWLPNQVVKINKPN
jgi:ribonuclease Z